MENTVPCPTCARPLHGNGVVFDHLGHTVYSKLPTMRLTPTEADVLEVLRQAWPNVVSAESLMLRGWPIQCQPDRNNLNVHISKLRKKLAPLGIRIVTVYGHSYRPGGYFLRGTPIVPFGAPAQRHGRPAA